MDLISGQPYWLLKNGFSQAYPRLTADCSADALIMGGGITGALVAWRLARAGHRVVVVDRRHIGMGSTAASTALLQYEIDTPLHRLIEMIGPDDAARSYELSVAAVDRLGEVARELHFPEFGRRPSLYFASTKKDIPDLEREYAARSRSGIPVDFWAEDTLKQHFPLLQSHAALWTPVAAEVDPYAFCHALLQDAIRHGAAVYDCTEVEELIHHARSVEARIAGGPRVRARRLVIACGYESQQFLPKPVVTLHSTYALVTKPLADVAQGADNWYQNCLIWESARPYLYARMIDGRVMAGGKDDPFYSPARRDRNLARKTAQLERLVERRLLGRPVETDFNWAGTFAETPDGLPFIGSVRERPNTWFALGMGGNGIVFSMIAADALADVFAGTKKSPEAIRLFRFGR